MSRSAPAGDRCGAGRRCHPLLPGGRLRGCRRRWPRPLHRAGRRGSGRRRSAAAAAGARGAPPTGRSPIRRAVASRLGRSGTSAVGTARRFPARVDVDRLAVRDRHQPRLDVGVGRQIRIGAERGQERLRPGVLGLGRADDGSADAQHRRAVPGHDRLERGQAHVR